MGLIKKLGNILLMIAVVSLLAGCRQSEPEFYKSIPYSLTYVDSEGNLRVKNFTEGIDNILIEGEFISFPAYTKYEVNWDKDLIAYVWNDGDMDREFVLYDIKTNERAVLSENAHVGNVEWSPNYRYLLLDAGTYVWRAISIYDTETKILTPIEFPVFSGPIWSFDGNRLAVGIEEDVLPETPVGEGESVTTVILEVSNNFAMSIVARGTSEYNTNPVAWLDENTLLIEKYYFNNSSRVYEKIDLASNKSEEFLEDIQSDISLYSYSLSSDNKYKLYEKNGEILLQSLETGETAVVDEGFVPQW